MSNKTKVKEKDTVKRRKTQGRKEIKEENKISMMKTIIMGPRVRTVKKTITEREKKQGNREKKERRGKRQNMNNRWKEEKKAQSRKTER